MDTIQSKGLFKIEQLVVDYLSISSSGDFLNLQWSFSSITQLHLDIGQSYLQLDDELLHDTDCPLVLEQTP